MSILKEIEFRVFNKKNIVKPKPISQTYEMVFLRIFFRNLLKSFERSASKSKYISDSQTFSVKMPFSDVHEKNLLNNSSGSTISIKLKFFATTLLRSQNWLKLV